MQSSSIMRDWSLYLMDATPAEAGDKVFMCNPNFPLLSVDVESRTNTTYRFEMDDIASAHYVRGMRTNDFTCFFYRRNGKWLAM